MLYGNKRQHMAPPMAMGGVFMEGMGALVQSAAGQLHTSNLALQHKMQMEAKEMEMKQMEHAATVVKVGCSPTASDCLPPVVACCPPHLTPHPAPQGLSESKVPLPAILALLGKGLAAEGNAAAPGNPADSHVVVTPTKGGKGKATAEEEGTKATSSKGKATNSKGGKDNDEEGDTKKGGGSSKKGNKRGKKVGASPLVGCIVPHCFSFLMFLTGQQ